MSHSGKIWYRGQVFVGGRYKTLSVNMCDCCAKWKDRNIICFKLFGLHTVISFERKCLSSNRVNDFLVERCVFTIGKAGIVWFTNYWIYQYLASLVTVTGIREVLTKPIIFCCLIWKSFKLPLAWMAASLVKFKIYIPLVIAAEFVKLYSWVKNEWFWGRMYYL